MESMLLLDQKTQLSVEDNLPKECDLYALSRFFAIFSDPTRLKILSALSLTTLCVSDLAKIIGTNQSTVSHQLASLLAMGLVSVKRQGKIRFYNVKKEVVSNLLLIGVKFLGY